MLNLEYMNFTFLVFFTAPGLALQAAFKKKKVELKLTGLGEDYTNGCLLDYGYIKNHCRLIVVQLII